MISQMRRCKFLPEVLGHARCISEDPPEKISVLVQTPALFGMRVGVRRKLGQFDALRVHFPGEHGRKHR
jgi:hypothetical protein